MSKKHLSSYINFLKKNADLKRPLKIVADCSNGSTALIWKNLTIPKMKVFVINAKIDGNFPAHGPNPLARGATTQVKKEITKKAADFGVVFDGDGDRAIFINNKSQTLPPHVTALLLFGSHNHKPPYVADIYVYYLLKLSGYKNLESIIPSRVGSRLVKQKMRAKKASAGAEISGHHYFKEMLYAESSALAVIEIANLVSRSEKNLSDFHNSLHKVCFSHFSTPKRESVAEIAKKMEARFRGGKINRLDGVTLEFTNYILNVRESNTEPILRIFVAATNNNLFKSKSKEMKNLLHAR